MRENSLMLQEPKEIMKRNRFRVIFVYMLKLRYWKEKS